MTEPLDLFISFHPASATPVQKLRAALEAVGVVSCASTGELSALYPIELARAKAFLAWGSRDYFRSRACQNQLVKAFLAWSQEAAVPTFERLLLVNAEAGLKHIYPIPLRELVFALAPGLPEAMDFDDLAGILQGHTHRLTRTLGDFLPLVQPGCRLAFDRIDRPAPRFEGRERELWDIHFALHPLENGPDAAPVVVVSGAGGQGKSALAREYAFRFGPAYPGGVFWLSAAEAKPAVSLTELSVNPPLRVQLAALLRRLAPDLDIEELDVPGLSTALGTVLAGSERPFLWIVDGLPDGLNGPAFREWLAPDSAGGYGHSLLTTATQRYDGRATPLHLPPLDIETAAALLQREAAATDESEYETLAWLLESLGRHSGAIATASTLAGAKPRGRRGAWGGLCRRLENMRRTAEDLVSRQPGRLPEGCEAEALAVYLCTLQELGEPARDLLRLAAETGESNLPRSFAADCFRLSRLSMEDDLQNGGLTLHLGEPPPEPMTAKAARLRVDKGIAELERFALAVATAGGVEVGPGIARIMSWVDPSPTRRTLLRTAALEALSVVVERCVGEGCCYALEPLAIQARALLAYLRSLAIETDGDPADITRRVRLALGLADLDRIHGALASALAGYRATATYLARAMIAEPGNGARQRDYAVIQERIGDVEQSRGELSGALDCFRKSLGIRTFLAGRDSAEPERHEEILRLHHKIAEILTAQGDSGGTLCSYRAAHAIYEKRARENPADISRRFDLGRSFERLAGLFETSGGSVEAHKAMDSALYIYRQLAEEQPERMEFVRACAGVHTLLGDLLRVRADLQGALEQYRAALALTEKVLAAEPEAIEEQRALALVHSKIAEVLTALEDAPGAAEHYRIYLDIAGRPVMRGRTEGLRIRDQATACMKLGLQLEQMDDPVEALAYYRKARPVLEKLARRIPPEESLRKDLAWLVERIETLEPVRMDSDPCPTQIALTGYPNNHPRPR